MIERFTIAPAPAAVSTSSRFPAADQFAVSLLWFALFANWLTVVPVIVPDQIALMLGSDTAAKEGVSGSVLAIGAFMALIMAPVAGSLSDRVRRARGRRGPGAFPGRAGGDPGLPVAGGRRVRRGRCALHRRAARARPAAPGARAGDSGRGHEPGCLSSLSRNLASS